MILRLIIYHPYIVHIKIIYYNPPYIHWLFHAFWCEKWLTSIKITTATARFCRRSPSDRPRPRLEPTMAETHGKSHRKMEIHPPVNWHSYGKIIGKRWFRGGLILHVWFNWLTSGKTGNQRFSREIWDFPVCFSLNQSIDSAKCLHGYGKSSFLLGKLTISTLPFSITI